MSGITRRRLIKSAALGTAALIFPGFTGFAAAGSARVRPSAYSAEGRRMLALYAKAVAVMMERSRKNLGDPTGWTFQWYTHWVPGTEADDTTKTEVIAQLPDDQRAAAQTMWNSCQGHGSHDRKSAGIRFFLPWHRMELYYLERIIRLACGDDSFVLPYWDCRANPVLPPELRDPGSPLYFANRRQTNGNVNNGAVVPTSDVTYDCLGVVNYDSEILPYHFSAQISANPHGIMHDLIGNDGAASVLDSGMAFVPTAARDPVFFLHHCNIDRLWASWNTGGRQNPMDEAWLKKQFAFADTDGSVYQRSVGEFSDIAALGYSYEHLEPVTRLAQAGLAKAAPPRLVGESRKGGISLTESTTIALTPPKGLKSFGKAAGAATSATKYYLVISGISAEAPVGTTYVVYVGAPEGAAGKDLEPYYVGVLSFFEAVGMRHMGGYEQAFDVTRLMGKIIHFEDRDRLHVRLASRGAPQKAAKPSVDRVTLLAE